MDRRQIETRSIEADLKRILADLDYLQHPSVPELSFRPDFMIRFDSQLEFVEFASLTNLENVDWKTLRLIEHIFEVKLFFGNKSSFSLILLDRHNWKPYCTELLENFSDRVIYEPVLKRTEDFYATPKSSNFRLWDLEREFERSRHKEFEEAYLRAFIYKDVRETDFERELSCRLTEQYGSYPRRKYSIRNLKNYYLKEDMNLRFYFDFFINRKIIEIKSFRKIHNAILQNLLIKARLIRYQKIDDEIRRAPMEIDKMILFINGNISGPQYDKLRYLRMLTAAGWDVYPVNAILGNTIGGPLP